MLQPCPLILHTEFGDRQEGVLWRLVLLHKLASIFMPLFCFSPLQPYRTQKCQFLTPLLADATSEVSSVMEPRELKLAGLLQGCTEAPLMPSPFRLQHLSGCGPGKPLIAKCCNHISPHSEMATCILGLLFGPVCTFSIFRKISRLSPITRPKITCLQMYQMHQHEAMASDHANQPCQCVSIAGRHAGSGNKFV